MSVSCQEGGSQEVRKTNPGSQPEVSSESVSVVTSQAVVSRVPGVASAQQTFCCQQGGSGLWQDSDGQVTSFFPLPGVNPVGGVAGRMAWFQKQPFRCVKKQAQLGEAAHRAWQSQDWGYSHRLPNQHDSQILCVKMAIKNKNWDVRLVGEAHVYT